MIVAGAATMVVGRSRGTTTRKVAEMKEWYTVVTRKGQVTVPADIRKALGLEVGDRVAFVLQDGEARLTRQGSVVEQTAGILKSNRPPLSAEQLREAAEEAIAQEAVERAAE